MKKLTIIIGMFVLFLFPVVCFAWNDENDAYRDGTNPYYSPSQSPYSSSQQEDRSFREGYQRGYNRDHQNDYDSTGRPLLLNPPSHGTLGDPGRRDSRDSTGRSLLR
jgi:hypothetical protein